MGLYESMRHGITIGDMDLKPVEGQRFARRNVAKSGEFEVLAYVTYDNMFV